jgi:hypothetical protein
MAGRQHRRANSGSDNVNQEHDHLDVILDGLGIHQIEEHMECREALHQDMESPFGYDCVMGSEPRQALLFESVSECVSSVAWVDSRTQES